jgi:phospholipid-binding lipoprotein MlaA
LRPRHLFPLLAVGLAVVAGQARSQTPEDPYEKINRRFFESGVQAEQKYFRPVVRLYHALTPGLIGVAIHNFITNLGEPVVVSNDILQLRVQRAANDLARLVTNTTFGIGGIIDLAKREGLPHRDNDFGVTLGRYGVKPGPYLFLPFLGPSDMRDALGTGVDMLLNPLTWTRFPGHQTLQITTGILGALDQRVNAQAELEAATAEATDPYATIRSDYLQSREAAVRGEDEIPVLTPIDEPPAPPSGAGLPTSPSAAFDRGAPHLAALDALDAPIATAPSAAAAQLAAADDPDLPIATAQPADRDPAPALARYAGL